MVLQIRCLLVGIVILLAVAGGLGADRIPGPHGSEGVTPNNWTLSPAGVQLPIGDRPMGAALSPDGRYLVISNDGQGVQSLALVDTEARAVVQTIPYKAPEALYVGVVWTRDGRRVYASAGGNNLIRTYEMRDGRLAEVSPISLGPPSTPVYPAGLAISPDGGTLLVAENLAHRVRAVDLVSGQPGAEAQTGPLPFAVAATGEKAYVSNWGDRTITVLRVAGLTPVATVPVGRHPGALAVDPVRPRLYVANTDDDSVSVIDTTSDQVVTTLPLAPYPGAPEGSVPDGLGVSPDGRWLFVANAGNNDVAAINLGTPAGGGPPKVAGLIPTAWYPTTVSVSRDGKSLFVTNMKGLGAGPNPNGPSPVSRSTADTQYIGSMIVGTVSIIPVPDGPGLAGMTMRVVRNNGFDETRNALVRGPREASPQAIPRRVGSPSLIKHVIYVVKENRTYDQVFGDLSQGNGDRSLLLFGREVTPNHHSLAEEFVLLDNFYADAEVSADGHNWATAAIANDYVQKNWPASYSDRGRPYDFEGGQPAAYPRSGFLWDAAARARVSYRIYGEFTEFEQYPSRETMPSLKDHVAPTYHGWDIRVKDQTRIDEWLAEFGEFDRQGTLPQLTILRLPNDHTVGTRPGYPTPQAMVADNDLALGRLAEAVSRSRYAADTAILVVEDDAQDGPDHVDAHRTIALVAGPYVRRGTVDHTVYSTVSLLRTIELILGIPPLTQYDAAAQPLLGAFNDTPQRFEYRARIPRQPLTAVNPANAPGAAESLRLPMAEADEAPPATLNRILWRAIKGDIPMPPPRSTRR